METVGLNKISFKEGVVMQKKVKLGDIATLITKGTTPTSIGYSFVDSGVNFIKIESLNDQGGFIPEKFAFISEDCNANMQRSQLRENDILFSIAGAIGKKAVVSNNILPANTNQALAIIRIPKGKINHQYLFYALESDGIKKQFEKQKQGVAQLNLSLKDISELEINLVSQEEQDKTVAVIGNVDKLIDKRKQQIQKLDELVKARFVEMFGAKGNVKVVKKTLGNICEFQQGTQIPVEKQYEEYVCGYERFLRIIDYTQPPQPPRYVSVVGKKVDEKSVVIVRYGATAGFVGRGYCGILANNLFEVIPDERVMSKDFLFLALKYGSFEMLIHDKVFGAAMPALSFSMMNDITIVVPNLTEQEIFTDFAAQIDKSKLHVQKSLDKLETLKKALMQKYFG